MPWSTGPPEIHTRRSPAVQRDRTCRLGGYDPSRERRRARAPHNAYSAIRRNVYSRRPRSGEAFMPPLLTLRRAAPKRSFRGASRRPTLGTVPEPTVKDQQPFSREGVAHWPLYLCLLRNWAKRLFQRWERGEPCWALERPPGREWAAGANRGTRASACPDIAPLACTATTTSTTQRPQLARHSDHN